MLNHISIIFLLYSHAVVWLAFQILDSLRTATNCLSILSQLFAEEDEDTDLADNFIVKTCQKFIPVTCNALSPSLSQALVDFYFSGNNLVAFRSFFFFVGRGSGGMNE